MFGKDSSFSSTCIFNSVFRNIILPLCLIPLGSAIFTINPTNVTTCLGSPTVFTCVITESLTINWLINGTPSLPAPSTTPLTPGPGAQSTLSVTATSELNGAPVQCYYTPSVLLPSIVSPPAYLSVQAPPSAPTNLTTTVLNATSVLLAWGPPNGTRSPSLFYRVLVTSGNGTQVYNKTVKELQLIHTTPDPCDQYWANVTAVYVSSNFAVCTGNSIMKAINGGPPDSIYVSYTSLQYSTSTHDNVNVTFNLLTEPRICHYTIRAVADDGATDAPLNKSGFASGGMINTTLPLLPLKHYNVSITAVSAYGMNPPIHITISTFSVINVTTNTTEPQCDYYSPSPAIGCVVHLKHAKSDVTYCRVLGRSNDKSVNQSLCNSSYSNGPLSTGIYSVDAYDIGSDGNVSSIKAISGHSLYLSTALQGTTTSGSLSLGAIVGGVVGATCILILLAVLALSAAIGIIIWKNMQKTAQVDSERELSEHLERIHATVPVSHYGEIDFTAMRPIVPPPLDNTEIQYATVKNEV